MVVRESQKLICKPLTQISNSGGMERCGQNSPSILMEEVTFFMLVCVSYTEVHQNSMAEGTQTLHWGQPWLRSAEPHVKPPEAPGNFQTQQNHSKEKRGKGSEKGHSSPISTPVPGSWALPCRWSLLSVLCRRTELTESRLS